MRKLSVRTIVATAATAVVLSLGLAATPASAHGFGGFHGGFGGFHGGFHGGYHGYHGFGYRGGWIAPVRNDCFTQRRFFVNAWGQLRVRYVNVCY